MTKILLIIAAVLILSLIAVLVYCAMVVAGRLGKGGRRDDREESLKNQICPRCKTGKHTYELDPKSEMCPYLECLKKGKCHFYVPLDEEL